MKRLSFFLALTLAAFGGLTIGCGGSSTPEANVDMPDEAVNRVSPPPPPPPPPA